MLTLEDAAQFVAALGATPEPTPRAIAAAKAYKSASCLSTDSSDLRIEHFDPARHNRAGFSCGVERLNNFLKLNAKKQQKEDMTRVYVAVEDGNDNILGYQAIDGRRQAGQPSTWRSRSRRTAYTISRIGRDE